MSQNITGDIFLYWEEISLTPVGFNSLGGLAVENERGIAQSGHVRQSKGVQGMNAEQLQRYHVNS